MIDINLLKAHLKFDDDEYPDDEDIYLNHLIESAIDAFNNFSNRLLIAPDAELPDPVNNAIKLTKSIEQGALLLIGHWYLNRESVVVGVTGAEVPLSTQTLWRPHRWNKF